MCTINDFPLKIALLHHTCYLLRPREYIVIINKYEIQGIHRLKAKLKFYTPRDICFKRYVSNSM